MANPFDTTDIQQRRLRFDVLALAYQIQANPDIDTGGENSIVGLAARLMDFVDDKVTV